MGRPSNALVVAVLALGLSVTGTAVARSLITSADIKDHTIKTVDLSARAAADLRDQRSPLDPTRIVHVAGPVFTLSAGQPGPTYYAAPCPDGAIALGGGFTITGTVHVSSSQASDFQQGWQISADNPGAQTGTAQANVVCITT